MSTREEKGTLWSRLCGSIKAAFTYVQEKLFGSKELTKSEFYIAGRIVVGVSAALAGVAIWSTTLVSLQFGLLAVLSTFAFWAFLAYLVYRRVVIGNPLLQEA